MGPRPDRRDHPACDPLLRVAECGRLTDIARFRRTVALDQRMIAFGERTMGSFGAASPLYPRTIALGLPTNVAAPREEPACPKQEGVRRNSERVPREAYRIWKAERRRCYLRMIARDRENHSLKEDTSVRRCSCPQPGRTGPGCSLPQSTCTRKRELRRRRSWRASGSSA